MNMNSRKMNNYSLMRISTVFVLTFALVVSTFSISFVPRTGAESLDNSPPNIPSNPGPTNGAVNVSIDVDLNWTGGDPDGNPVTYNVYFGPTNPPMKVADNQTKTTYNTSTMNFSTKYYWHIIAWDNLSASTNGPLWEFTTEAKTNNPPNVPHTEVPGNGSTNVAITAVLSWIGGDPDVGDVVRYDVYLGTSNPPGNVAVNLTNTNYDHPGDFAFNTTYYWRIIARDNNNASTTGPVWHFTTLQKTTLKVTITKPLGNKLYFNDEERIDLSGKTIVYGKITITIDVTSSTDITKVQYWVDGKLIKEYTNATYSYLWQPFIQFNSALSLKRTIKVVVFDSEGNNASDEINITKWRFHPLPFVLAGLALASGLVLHTKVTGLFYNFQQSKISVSFYAVRARFKTTGPLRSARGVINSKHCSGGFIIGPMKMFTFGPFHKFSYGTFTFIGTVHYDTRGFGQGLLKGILQPRGTIGNVLNLVRNLRS